MQVVLGATQSKGVRGENKVRCGGAWLTLRHRLSDLGTSHALAGERCRCLGRELE
jgi:hypothetical protein